ncbi:hypothetical protein HZS_7305 [Henneguya salminicola]|nr:hypothetical protein HZS_7305 [Henneguya salminicola]
MQAWRAHNPAKSCKDIAMKGLLKNQPDMYYIKTEDMELLQVFCPQTYTFQIDASHNEDIMQSNFSTSIDALVIHPDNETNFIITSGNASTNENDKTQNLGRINLIINQTTSFNTNSKLLEAGKSREPNEDYQNLTNLTDNLEKQMLEEANNLNITNATSMEDTLFFAKVANKFGITDVIFKN